MSDLLTQLGVGTIHNLDEWHDVLKWLLIELLLRREDEIKRQVWALMDGKAL